MEEGARPAHVAAHVRSIADRDWLEADRLLARIAASCWPGGPLDRRRPAAVEWVRRWRPAGVAPALADCSCAAGRCPVCN